MGLRMCVCVRVCACVFVCVGVRGKILKQMLGGGLGGVERASAPF